MHTEFEITFPSIDIPEVQDRIRALGGICTKPRIKMRRVVFLHPTDPHGYLRVRDEGDRVTTTYKHISDGELTIASVQEIECVVSDFDSMREIYLAMGLVQKAYQETYREIWSIDNEIECMIDEWPGLRPFIEIEGANEDVVRKYTERLGFAYAEGFFGAVDRIYEKELGIPCEILNNHTPVLTFDNPPQRYV